MNTKALIPYALIVLGTAAVVAVLWVSSGETPVAEGPGPAAPPADVPEPGPPSLPRPPAAHQWPMHRGRPELTGLSDASPAPSPELLWSVEVSGPIRGGAAIADGTVYLATDAGTLHALSLDDGRERWSVDVGGAVEGVPLITGEAAYVGTLAGRLIRVDLADRAIRWRYETGDRIHGSANLVRLPTSPEWMGEQGEPTPLATAARTLIVVGSYDGKLHAVDAATGQAAWTVPTENFIHGAPAVSAGKVVFAGCDALLHVVSAATGEPALAADAGAYVAASPAVVGGVAYVGNYEGTFLAVDLVSGERLWEYVNESELPFYASPAVSGEVVLAAGRDKTLTALGRADGKVRWTARAGRKIDSAPVVAGGRVFFGSDDGRLHAVALDTGDLVWSYQVGPPILAAPAVSEDGRIVVADEDGTVYCFGARP